MKCRNHPDVEMRLLKTTEDNIKIFICDICKLLGFEE